MAAQGRMQIQLTSLCTESIRAAPPPPRLRLRRRPLLELRQFILIWRHQKQRPGQVALSHLAGRDVT